MDDTTGTATPSPSPAATTAAGYDAARDKTNEPVAAAAAAAVTASGIRLLIKSSNQQYDDVNIESDLCWTVQRLKKQLSLVYPGKPEINDQKLIYSGKLLDDAQKLSEVIRSYKDVYQQHHIFHLVCANKNAAVKAPYKTTTPPKAATSTARVDPTNNPNNDNELRQRHVAAAAAAAAAAATQHPYQQPNLQQTNDPHLWFQLHNQAYQMAMGQNASTSAAAVVTGAGAASTPSSTSASTAPNPHGGVVSPGVLPPFMQTMPGFHNNMGVPLVAHQPVPVAAGAAAGQPNEEAAARRAAPQPVDGPNFPNIQEEPEVRDWLDSFFSFTRLAIFVTVLYFNSSPMRCLMVVLIASVIYLYHIGVLRRRRERNNNNINRNNNAGNNVAAFAAVQEIQRMMDAAVEQDNNPQAADAAAAAADQPNAAPAPAAPAAGQNGAAQPAASAAAGGDQATDAAAASAEAVVVEPANANNSVISIVRTFVITFFTSLLPEAPAL
ncbi:PREDICTED: homocysteine-responsive endoplasmic reticulum-resident ubiquitin-like domain member 2 protein [Drosophila arizonae]|uniref:Homocysteine-responsive endoplasmic reticulum-resident ubiquitin-like domain member 2 protein n=1 Tax=Drosophila arizonae TaxID=7263 RepID=A0ABM1NPI6_DROAR|nr:PREDICTED: homocysteine-responsive endoplasmic reticulum-resident ubiquitin-like domain member 2 protein [Drosophila arizonae]